MKNRPNTFIFIMLWLALIIMSLTSCEEMFGISEVQRRKGSPQYPMKPFYINGKRILTDKQGAQGETYFRYFFNDANGWELMFDSTTDTLMIGDIIR